MAAVIIIVVAMNEISVVVGDAVVTTSTRLRSQVSSGHHSY